MNVNCYGVKDVLAEIGVPPALITLSSQENNVRGSTVLITLDKLNLSTIY